jgi:hypothetical protein
MPVHQRERLEKERQCHRQPTWLLDNVNKVKNEWNAGRSGQAVQLNATGCGTHTRKIDIFIAIPFLYVIYHYYLYILSTKSTSAYCLIIYFSVGHLYRQSLTIKKNEREITYLLTKKFSLISFSTNAFIFLILFFNIIFVFYQVI